MSFDVAPKTTAAEQWMDSEDIPDPKKLLRIGGLTTVVRPVPIRKKVGNIILPDTFRESISYLTNVARVLAVSDQTETESEYWAGLKWQVGDYVVFGKFTGIRMKFKGVKLIMLNDKDIKGIVDDPADIDPSFNIDGGSA